MVSLSADSFALIAVALLVSMASVGTIIGLVVKRKLTKRRLPKVDNELQPLPGPVNLPIVGAAYIIARFKNPWHGFLALREQYGDVYGIKLGSVNCVVVSSVEGIKEVLAKKGSQFENRPDFLRFHTIFRGERNYSIALCDWSSKQRTRRKIACPFTHPRVSSYGGTKMNTYITRELEELVSRLKPFQNQAIEPHHELLITTANIFFQFFCSKRFSPEDKLFCKIVETYDIVFHQLFQSFAIDFMPWLKVFNRKNLKALEDMANIIPEFTKEIFREHREQKGEKQGDLIDVLFDHADSTKNEVGSLTQEDIHVIVDDLIGGHSVLANSWQWGLYFLGGHPEVRARIRQETAEVTQNTRRATMEDIGSMSYTFATVMELLRFISSPIIPHVAAEDTSIMGYEVRKGTMVLFNTITTNMSSSYYDDPRLFKPERFLNVDGKVRKPDYFFPFSIGKRTCLGDALVKNTLTLAFSTLLQCFDIVLPPDVKVPLLPEISYELPGDILPKSAIRVIFKPIT